MTRILLPNNSFHVDMEYAPDITSAYSTPVNSGVSLHYRKNHFMIRYYYPSSMFVFIIDIIPAPEIELDDVNINYMPQRYVLQLLSGFGVAGNQLATSANICSSNPASLNNSN